MWPGMAYYLTLFYPPSRTGKRIGQYFTAAQVSAAVVGLVSAGFQEMDGLRGLVGFQWMFLLYGLVGILVGISLLWWLPDRPLPPGGLPNRSGWHKWFPQSRPALTGEDAQIHYEDLTRVYHRRSWAMVDLWHVVTDWRIWPLVMMYFGVVGVGIGVQSYATVILRATNEHLTGIQLSLLSAPIWIVSRPELFGQRVWCCLTVANPDGFDRYSHRHSLLRSLPPSPCPVLQRSRLYPNCWAPDDNLRRQHRKPLATLRWTLIDWVWSWPYSPNHHDLDE